MIIYIKIPNQFICDINLRLLSIDAMAHNLTRLNVTFSTSFQTIMPKLKERNDMRISTEDPYRLAVSRNTGKLRSYANGYLLLKFFSIVQFVAICKHSLNFISIWNKGDVTQHRYLVLTVDDISNVTSDRDDLHCMVVAVYGMVLCILLEIFTTI